MDNAANLSKELSNFNTLNSQTVNYQKLPLFAKMLPEYIWTDFIQSFDHFSLFDLKVSRPTARVKKIVNVVGPSLLLNALTERFKKKVNLRGRKNACQNIRVQTNYGLYGFNGRRGEKCVQ